MKTRKRDCEVFEAAEADGVFVESVAKGGCGLVRTPKGVCFVKGALPGERVRLRSMVKRSGVYWADIDGIEAASPHRLTPSCPVFGVCGGCDWFHFAYPDQGGWKRRMLEETLRRVGGIEASAEWREDANLRMGYRTRATFHGGPAGWGFYREGSRRVAPIEACPLCHPALNAALRRLPVFSANVSVQLTAHPESAEMLAWTRRATPALREALPGLQDDATPPEERHAFVYDGRWIVNGAFCQSSLMLNRLLVAALEELAAGQGPLLDLYCGNGNLSAGFARTGREVRGLDHSAAAVWGARQLEVGGYEQGGEPAFRAALEAQPWETVVLDPPREGAKPLLDALLRARPSRIVYVGCDPAAFARDVGKLASGGYALLRVIGLDLFPQTHHLEAVALLEAE